MTEIAVAPDASRYLMIAAFASGDLAAGRATVSTSTTSLSIVIGDLAREMTELHTLGGRGRQKALSNRRRLAVLLLQSGSSANPGFLASANDFIGTFPAAGSIATNETESCPCLSTSKTNLV